MLIQTPLASGGYGHPSGHIAPLSAFHLLMASPLLFCLSVTSHKDTCHGVLMTSSQELSLNNICKNPLSSKQDLTYWFWALGHELIIWSHISASYKRR